MSKLKEKTEAKKISFMDLSCPVFTVSLTEGAILI